MGWRQEQEARDRALQQTLSEIQAQIRDLTPAVVSKPLSGPVGRDPRRIPGLALSLRLCRDVESGQTLLQALKPVPREHREGPHGLTVNCLCGAQHETRERLEPCPGGCGRFFCGDPSGVWAVMLPAQEPDELAA